MSREISIVRGTTNAFGISVTDADNIPYILEEGQTLVFAVKKRATDIDRVLIKKITNQAEGLYYLELEPSDTADLETGKYFYDVGLQHGDTVFYNIIEASVLNINPNITQLGDGS